MPDQISRNIAQALADWAEVLDSDGLVGPAECAARFGPNVSEFAIRDFAAALRPRATTEVVRIVDIANRFDIPLYPISTGGNWGLGSKLPPGDGCAIVDLSRMNRVLEINTQLGYADVQPGVSQATLATALRKQDVPWRLNVTGAGGSTSVVANALERGVGMLGQRHHDIHGLEVVLGTGELLRLGLDHHHYPIGAGPDMTGLFVQSNFGIVTRAVIRLQPNEGVCLFFAETDDATIGAFIDAIRRLRQRGLLGHRTEIMAANDPRLTGRLKGGPGSTRRSWGTWGAIYGEPPLREVLRDLIEHALQNSCRSIEFFDQANAGGGPLAPDIAARLELAQGLPNDSSIRSLPRSPGMTSSNLDLDPAVPGMLAVLPAVPLVGKDFRHIVTLVYEEGEAENVQPVLSFSTISEIAAEGFIRVHFDRRDPAAVERAHRWAQRLDRRLRTEKVPLLRLNIGQMAAFASVDSMDRRYLTKIERIFNPKQTMAPGRYSAGGK